MNELASPTEPFLDLIQQLLLELKPMPPDDPRRSFLEHVVARLRAAAEESLRREQTLVVEQSDDISQWLSWLSDQIRSGDAAAQVLGQTIIENLSAAQRGDNEWMGQTVKPQSNIDGSPNAVDFRR